MHPPALSVCGFGFVQQHDRMNTNQQKIALSGTETKQKELWQEACIAIQQNAEPSVTWHDPDLT